MIGVITISDENKVCTGSLIVSGWDNTPLRLVTSCDLKQNGVMQPLHLQPKTTVNGLQDPSDPHLFRVYNLADPTRSFEEYCGTRLAIRKPQRTCQVVRIVHKL